MDSIALDTMVAAFFTVESEAYQAFAELREDAYNDRSTISQMALVQKRNGQVIPCEAFDAGEDTKDDTIAGGFLGALIGIIGGPLGILLGGGVGAMIGSVIDNNDMDQEFSLIERITTRMQDGDTAVIALVEESDEEIINHKIRKFDAVIVRWDAEDIREEMKEAREVEKALAEQAKREMKENRKAERKGRHMKQE